MISLLAASFNDIMTTVLYIVIALLVLLIMITIHELGHYAAGKWLKFKIEEFAIGFGKPIFSRKVKSGEKFSIRVLPLGGFCAFKGEDIDVLAPDDFNAQKPWKRIIVQLAGVAANFISAFFFAFILLLAFGYDIPQIKSVDADSVNYGVIQAGDIVLEINGEEISFIKDTTFNGLLGKYDIGENIELLIKRDGQQMTIHVTKYAANAEDTKGIIGVTPMAYKHNLIEAWARCIPVACTMAWKVLEFLFMLLTGAIGLSAIGGPITTITTIADYSAQNIANLFVFLPFIAANLAIFNLLPIPALDGARAIFTGIEWIRKKPVPRKIEGMIHFVGLVVLFAFVILVDIFHLLT